MDLPQQIETPRPQQPKRRRRYVAFAGVLVLVGTIAAVAVAFTKGSDSTTSDPSTSNKAGAEAATAGAASGSSSSSSMPFLGIKPFASSDKASTHGLLELSVPSASLNTPFIIHSVFDKGSAPLGKTVDNMERSNPAEDAENTVFHFELSESGKQLHLVREDYVTRSSDDQLEYALKEGLWTGHVDTLDILSSEDGVYTVAADSLVQKGFYVSEYVQGTPTIIQQHTRAFQENTNVLVQYQTYDGMTLSIFFSIMRLPTVPMNARVADDRVGFFAIRYKDLGMAKASGSLRQTDDIDRTVTIINRRRLERNEETGETINPIRYYIDPSVPKRWRPYFKQGVEIWKDAFAKAGFKNAIRAILPTDCDFPSDYHVGDMRYNTISVMMSNNVYALGPSVVDPRSGEILHSDITFAHGWVKSWVGGIESESPFVPAQTSTTIASQCHRSSNPEEAMQATFFNAYARYALGKVSDNTIGAAFRETVMHEVGHTIGLRHNFIASMSRTKEQLMDAEYTKKHGTTASVMDYVPTNIWSNMTQEQANRQVFFTPVLGEYDYAAIQYGYSEVADETPTYKNAALDELARATPDFATDEDKNTDQNPYAHTFDMAKDPIGYFLDRMDLIHVLRQNMLDRTVHEGESWTKLWKTEAFFLRYTNFIVGNLARFIGGIKIEKHAHRYGKAAAPTVEYVSKEDHMRVLNFASAVISNAEGIFPDPATYSMYLEQAGYPGSCDPSLSSYCYANKVADVDGAVQGVRGQAIQHVLNPSILQKLVMESNQAHLSIRELFSTVQQAVFKNPTDVNNFNVQIAFMSYMAQLARVAEQRIATEAKMALMITQMTIKSLLQSDSLPVEAQVHFSAFAKPQETLLGNTMETTDEL